MKRKTTIIIALVTAFCALLAYNNYYTDTQNRKAELAMLNAYAADGRRTGDLQLLARAVNGESRGESYTGQVAVAAVILNRVSHPSFPKTIAGVIYQPGAFTAVSDGQINVPLDPKSTVVKACVDALNGWDPSGGAIYYYNPAKTTNKWIWSRQVITRIGKHVFAR